MQQTLLQDIVRTRVDRDRYFDKLRSIEVGLPCSVYCPFLHFVIDNQTSPLFGLGRENKRHDIGAVFSCAYAFLLDLSV